MKTKDAESTLRMMLQVANVDLEKPDVLAFWQVYKEFARIPLEETTFTHTKLGRIDIDDSFLFQTGIYDFTYSHQETYHLSFVRQFYFSNETGIAWVEQLEGVFHYRPEPELRNLQISYWSTESTDLNNFFAWIEQTDEFTIPTQKFMSLRLEIYQGEW